MDSRPLTPATEPPPSPVIAPLRLPAHPDPAIAREEDEGIWDFTLPDSSHDDASSLPSADTTSTMTPTAAAPSAAAASSSSSSSPPATAATAATAALLPASSLLSAPAVEDLDSLLAPQLLAALVDSIPRGGRRVTAASARYVIRRSSLLGVVLHLNFGSTLSPSTLNTITTPTNDRTLLMGVCTFLSPLLGLVGVDRRMGEEALPFPDRRALGAAVRLYAGPLLEEWRETYGLNLDGVRLLFNKFLAGKGLTLEVCWTSWVFPDMSVSLPTRPARPHTPTPNNNNNNTDRAPVRDVHDPGRAAGGHPRRLFLERGRAWALAGVGGHPRGPLHRRGRAVPRAHAAPAPGAGGGV